MSSVNFTTTYCDSNGNTYTSGNDGYWKITGNIYLNLDYGVSSVTIKNIHFYTIRLGKNPGTYKYYLYINGEYQTDTEVVLNNASSNEGIFQINTTLSDTATYMIEAESRFLGMGWWKGDLDVWTTDFTPNYYKHTFKFLKNGLCTAEKFSIDNIITTRSNSSFNLPTADKVPIWVGHEFLGWGKLDSSSDLNNTQTSVYSPGSNYTDEESFNSNQTINLYAVWKWNGIVHVYDNGSWKNALPYIYTGSEWKQALPYICTDAEKNTWSLGVGS